MSYIKEHYINEYQKLLADYTDVVLDLVKHPEIGALAIANRQYAEKCFELSNADFEPVTEEDKIGYRPEEI